MRCYKMSFSFLIVIAALVGCGSTATLPANPEEQKVIAQKLCATPDLTGASHRELLFGGFYALKGSDLSCAERLTELARKKTPQDAYAALNLGAVYERQGKLESAKAEYLAAMNLDPQGASASGNSSDTSKPIPPGQLAKRNLSLMQQR